MDPHPDDLQSVKSRLPPRLLPWSWRQTPLFYESLRFC